MANWCALCEADSALDNTQEASSRYLCHTWFWAWVVNPKRFCALILLVSFCNAVFSVFITLRQFALLWSICPAIFALNLSRLSSNWATNLDEAFAWSALNCSIAAFLVTLEFSICVPSSIKNSSDWFCDLALNCCAALIWAWSVVSFCTWDWNPNIFACCACVKLVVSIAKNDLALVAATVAATFKLAVSIAA